jgi:hypothetical protein
MLLPGTILHSGQTLSNPGDDRLARRCHKRSMDESWLRQMSDDDLAHTIIDELAHLESRGVNLPDGWRGQPVSWLALDTLIELANAQLPLPGPNERPAALRRVH